MPAALTRSVF